MIAELAGTRLSKILNMVNTRMFVFKHPKYYKELRDAGNELAKRNAVRKPGMSGSSPARNKSDQAISLRAHDGECERASDPGLKHQASGSKQQASGSKLVKHQAASIKPQA